MNKKYRERHKNENEIIGSAEKNISKKGKTYYKGHLLFNGHAIKLLMFMGKNDSKLYFVLDNDNPEIK